MDGIGPRIEKIASMVGGKRSLAQALNISEAQIYRYIKGQNSPGVDIAQAMANAAGVSVHWLISGEDKNESHDTQKREAEVLDVTTEALAAPERKRQSQIVNALQTHIEALLAEGNLADPATLFQLTELNKALETALRALNQLGS
jgi:transcriptional regulator with XRE-family HTH domain